MFTYNIEYIIPQISFFGGWRSNREPKLIFRKTTAPPLYNINWLSCLMSIIWCYTYFHDKQTHTPIMMANRMTTPPPAAAYTTYFMGSVFGDSVAAVIGNKIFWSVWSVVCLVTVEPVNTTRSLIQSDAYLVNNVITVCVLYEHVICTCPVRWTIQCDYF